MSKTLDQLKALFKCPECGNPMKKQPTKNTCVYCGETACDKCCAKQECQTCEKREKELADSLKPLGQIK